MNSLARILACGASLCLLPLSGYGDEAKACYGPNPGNVTLKQAVECSPRSGLPNFFAKCEKGGKIRVAYFGGSITAQAGWRVQSLDFLRKRYPKAEFEEIYAPIGGTGSNLGVFRLESDVLKKKPDLLFVEFAVNDTGVRPETIRNSMEGIVRNTWEASPDCDICFVYTLTEQWLKDLQAGRFNPPATVHEEIAERYGIPTIHMGMEVASLEKEGKLAMKAPQAKVEQVAGKDLDKVSGVMANPDGKIPFAPEGVHPYLDTGHKLYEAAIERSWPKIEAASAKAPASRSTLPAPLSESYVRNVRFLDVSSAKLEGPWTRCADPLKELKTHPSVYVNADVASFLPSVWIGKPGATLSFKFKGKALMLYLLSGPASGVVELEVDGVKSKLRTFDGYSRSWRLNPAFPALSKELDVHSVALRVLDEKFDKRKLLNPGAEKFFDMAPETFEPTDALIGGICVEGELLPE